jgi:uncharacterized LabA/DUF88 family protein
MPSSVDKLALFIDGASLHSASKALGFEVDFKRLLNEYERDSALVRAHYYTVMIEDGDYSPIRPLTDWLDYNGYKVVTKPAKEFDDKDGRRKIKRSMNLDIAVDALELSKHIDHIVLFSGDSDFRPLVEALQRRGVHVTAVSTLSMISDELRRQADAFVDLLDLKTKIGRDPSSRNQPQITRF